MYIYFIRHGETLWNTLKIFQGNSNSPLTEKGIEQTKLLSERLKNIEFKTLYSSPLGRAQDTATILRGEKEREIVTINEFKEISMGEVEGIKRIEFESRFPNELYQFYNDPLNYDPTAFKGETFWEIKTRVINGLEKIVNSHQEGDNVLVVTHGATLKVLFSYIKDENLSSLIEEKVPANTSVSIIEYSNNKFKLLSISDTSHLEDIK